jgi:hypothetical protein
MTGSIADCLDEGGPFNGTLKAALDNAHTATSLETVMALLLMVGNSRGTRPSSGVV